MKPGDSSSSPEVPKPPAGNRFARFYTGSAVIILNTLVLLVLVNLALGVAFRGYDWYRFGKKYPAHKTRANAFFYTDGSPIDNGKRTDYQLDFYDFTACEGSNPKEAAAVLDDFFGFMQTWLIYQPWVQHADMFYRSTYLNVLPDDANFPRRRTANPDSPNKLPKIVVWTLGGSTTFGIHVADDQTWPSYLSRALNARARKERPGVQIKVENYGRSCYTPDQEAILLWDLLRSGQRPSLVIFMDGINLGTQYDYPYQTPQLAKIYQLVQQERLWTECLRFRALGRLANFFWKKLNPGAGAGAPVIPQSQRVRWSCNRLKDSWRLAGELCRSYGADLLVCLQPHPLYHYGLPLTRFPLTDEDLAREAEIAGFLDAVYGTLRREPGLLYLGDLYRAWGTRRKVYVDDIHYSPVFNKFLAENVAAHLDLKKLSVSPGYLPQAAAGALRPQDLGMSSF